VAEQGLDGSDVGALLKGAGCKRLAEFVEVPAAWKFRSLDDTIEHSQKVSVWVAPERGEDKVVFLRELIAISKRTL